MPGGSREAPARWKTWDDAWSAAPWHISGTRDMSGFGFSSEGLATHRERQAALWRTRTGRAELDPLRTGSFARTGGVLTPLAAGGRSSIEDASLGLENASEVVVDTFANMADAAVSESRTMESAVLDAFQNIIANLKTSGGGVFGQTLLGGFVGAALGIGASLLRRGHSPVPVTVSSYDPKALSQMEKHMGPDSITHNILADGKSVEEIEYDLRRRSRRDAISRFPGGGLAP
jgi:hypothetical protein